MPETQSGPAVLCYGHDEGLQTTRRWLLESTGNRCVTVMHACEYRKAVLLSQPRVIVLCHSLSAHEYSGALEFAEKNCPSSLILLVNRSPATAFPSHQHAALNTCDGPEAFLSAVRHLLEVSMGRSSHSLQMD